MKNALFLCLACLLCLGCKPTKTVVTGSVTLNGQPLEKGTVRFVPEDKASPRATGMIEKGRYEVESAPGKKVVEISSMKVVGKRKAYDTPDSPMIELTQEDLPEKFNGKTELRYEVKPGKNEKDFSLTKP